MKHNKISHLAFALIALFLFNTSSSAAHNTYVIGHLNPDPDSIAGAMGAAFVFDAIPARTGEINQETEFLLRYFNAKAPSLLKETKGKDIIAVDFNQKSQAPNDIEEANIIRIIDHHALQKAPLTSEKPIPVDIKPWGSVCTIIAKDYVLKAKKKPSKALLGMLLGAIISDTLNLRSETTTENDREMVRTLAKMVGIEDIDGFARKMFIAKSDVSKKTEEEIIVGDYKIFEMGGKKVGIGVMETLMPEQLFARKAALLEAAKAQKEVDGVNLLYFFIVDTENMKSDLLIIDKDEELIAEQAFGGSTKDNILNTGNLVSRKLQFVPAITKILDKK